MPSRRDIARALETVADFREPQVELEQYLTAPDLAAHICHLAAMRGDMDEATVVDLGCGTGMLALGARCVEADTIVGLDVDRAALETAVQNEKRLFDRRTIHWVEGDATLPPTCPTQATVISNPPFGAQHGNRHADRAFLDATAALASVSYTIHNAGSLDFVEQFASDHGASVTDAFESTIPIDHRFDHHTDARSSIDVEVFRIDWAGPNGGE
ncbi:putative RNA methylase [Halovivax ruber XH-70]|uniref:Putative RNA methylase n=2 Tax=Halovivax ruber TaxID=387341 RepID=L0I8N8_HALRX|nr:METTL5 family protein [Halovivax ruber]AGB15960.1 putative RNA methylase [Halovivax ruber XH-70]